MARNFCTADGCDRKVHGRGLCSLHYYEVLRAGRGECAIEGCTETWHARGLCVMHYTRLIRNGDPLSVQQIRLDDRARFESRVDRSGGPGACHPWRGPADRGGYGTLTVKRRSRKAHIIAWELARGSVPPGMQVDHECHNRAVREGTCKPGICLHRLCCNERHLAAKTPQEHRDDTEQWAMPKGSAHIRAKLTEDQVTEIRARLAAREVQKHIATIYGVSETAISRIKLGKSWAA